jgi:hypothetical protein
MGVVTAIALFWSNRPNLAILIAANPDAPVPAS